MKVSRDKGQPPQRQLRVGEEIRHILSTVLSKDLLFEDMPENGFITVTEVQIGPDLKNAFVFVMTLKAEKLEESVRALNHHVKYYRHEVASRIGLKFMPKLIFKPDLSYRQAEKFEDLLKSPHVAQDLVKKPVEEEDGSQGDI